MNTNQPSCQVTEVNIDSLATVEYSAEETLDSDIRMDKPSTQTLHFKHTPHGTDADDISRPPPLPPSDQDSGAATTTCPKNMTKSFKCRPGLKTPHIQILLSFHETENS